MSIFPQDDYLARVGLAGPPPLDLAGLTRLHRAQCFAVPFENVDPLLGRGVSLDPAAIEEKILRRGRGGYCFELNALFLAALRAFGFRASPRLGRVFLNRPSGGPRTHQASLVEIDSRTYLADVGFGGPGLVEPIPFEDGYVGEQMGRRVRVRQDPEWGLFLEDDFEGDWRKLYVLPPEPVHPADFAVGNYFCATHPESFFRQGLRASLPNAEGGRVTVMDRTAKITQGKDTIERKLSSLEDFRWLFTALRLPLPEDDIARVHAQLPPA